LVAGRHAPMRTHLVLVRHPGEQRAVGHEFGIRPDGRPLVDFGSLPEGEPRCVAHGGHPAALSRDSLAFGTGGVDHRVPIGPPGENRELQGTGHALEGVDE